MKTTEQAFDAGALASELARLRRNSHQSQRVLARTSTVSNTLISTLESADAAAPHPAVLRKLARGLATDGSGDVDPGRAKEHYLALMRAAGYVPPEPPATSNDDALFRRLLEARIGRENAPIIAAMLPRVRGMDPDEVRKLAEIVAIMLSRPGSQSER